MREKGMRLAPWARVAFATPPNTSCFFGYYYQSPLSADGRLLLAHRVAFEGRDLSVDDRAEVGYFDVLNGEWHRLGITSAFNWQQGSMLQWLGPDFQSAVIYNDQDGQRFVAKRAMVSSGSLDVLPHAVYAVHPSGSSALGVRFERHYFARAYRYEGIRDERWNVPIHPDDGILSVDLTSGAAKTLISTTDVASHDATHEMSGVAHWLVHVIWNPGGTRFGFLHSFGSREHYLSRLMTVDADGKGLFSLSSSADYAYTHMGWRDEATFSVFASRTKAIAVAYSTLVESTDPVKKALVAGLRIAKRFLPRAFVDRRRAESGYALVRDRVGRESWIATGILRRDGHPSWSRDGRFMLTDTYADEEGWRHLVVFDSRTTQAHTVGRFFSPYNDSSFRCDLHPRFSRDDKQIIIDSAHSGRRQILIIDLDWEAF